MSSDEPGADRALRRAWLLTLALGAGLAAATLTPADQLPAAPGSDKVHHALAFAVMVFPLTSARPSSALWLAPLAALYGGLIEYVQPLVNRSGDLADFVADLIGIGMGVGAGFIVHRHRRARGRFSG